MNVFLNKSKKIIPSTVKDMLPLQIKRDVKSSLKAFSLWHQTLNADSRSLPNFIIAGTQKGGTTALYSMLCLHPNVRPAMVKEIHFFDWYYSKGLRWYKAHFPVIDSSSAASDKGGPLVITGEASPYYMFYPYAFERIAEIIPEVRIILLLRDPVERAYSSYHQQLSMGRESHSFERALELESSRIAPEAVKIRQDENYVSFEHAHFSYMARGLYAEQVDRCFQFFPRKNTFIADSAKFFQHTQEFYREILNFLGLPKSEPSGVHYSNRRDYDDMRPDTKKWLVDFYRPHNERLFELIGERFDWSS